MIVDNQEKNIAFYRKDFLQDKEPTEKDVLVKQIQSLFEKYFWEKQ